MKTFNEWLEEHGEIQTEAALIVSGKHAYPKFNQILCMAGGAGCFAKGTLVHIANGFVNIEDVKVGDKVKSFNEITQEYEFKEVLELKEYPSIKRMIELEFDNGQKVVCSEDHKFYVDGKWIEAKDLSVSKKYINFPMESVYDLSVEDNFNYCITEDDIIVHNSGKGFVLNNVIAFTGKTFDVDDMKTKVINLARRNPDINLSKEFQKEYGKSLADINLKDPKDTSNLHVFLKKKGLDAKRKEIFFAQASGTKNKPNVIFDVTFKDMDAIEEVSAYAKIGGYDIKDIHIVWVLTELCGF